MKRRSVAVIGGGLGGMSAAGELAHAGHRVVLFEQSPMLGGKAQVVSKNGALPAGEYGLLVCANQSNFRDGFLAQVLVRRAGRDGYLVMEEQHLSRYRFLSRLGAFSIRRKDSRSTLETLRYARGVLQRPRAAMFIFSPGRIEPNRAPPLRFERGVEVLARMSRARCVPVAFRYALLEHEYPDAMIQVGEPHPPVPRAELEERLDGLVAGLQGLDHIGAMVPLLSGRRSVAQRWDAARGLT